MSTKTSILEKLSEFESDSLEKFAFSQLDRKSISKELAKAQKEHNKAREEWLQAKSNLDSLTARAERAKAELSASAKRIVELSQISRDLDLSGADSVSRYGDDIAYIINGRKMHVDTSDVNDIKITPWKEYMKSKEEDKNKSANEEEYTFQSFEEFLADVGSKDLEDTGDISDYEDLYLGEKFASIEDTIVKSVVKKFR